MDKKKILIASFFAAIMILVPFTAATGSIDFLKKVNKTLSKDEQNNLIRLPETIDLSGTGITPSEILEFKNDLMELNTAITEFEEDYGVNLVLREVPVMLDETVLMVVPELDINQMLELEDVSSGRIFCIVLFVVIDIATFYFALVTAFCSATGEFLVCAVATALGTTLGTLYIVYAKNCGSNKDSNIENDCGCQQNIDTPSVTNLDSGKADLEQVFTGVQDTVDSIMQLYGDDPEVAAKFKEINTLLQSAKSGHGLNCVILSALLFLLIPLDSILKASGGVGITLTVGLVMEAWMLECYYSIDDPSSTITNKIKPVATVKPVKIVDILRNRILDMPLLDFFVRSIMARSMVNPR